MKFLCPSCKAKYQIADEKIGGRTLKMDCRRCGHTIVLRADQADDASQTAASESIAPGPASVPPGARTPHAASSAGAQPAASSRGGSGLLHPQGGSRRSAGPSRTGSSHVGPTPARSALGADFRRNAGSTPATDAPRTTPLDQWHVAINDVPVGPMRRDEITRKISTGAIHQDSLAWREGFDDWRPLREIPELAALLRRTETSARPAEAPRPPAGRVPAPGARAAATAAPRTASGAGGRATASQPSRPAAPAASARSNVVAIGGRLGASAAPALEEDEPLDEIDGEPTRVASSFDFAAAEAAAKLEASAKAAPAKAAPAKAAPAKAPAAPQKSSATTGARKSSPPPAAPVAAKPAPAAPPRKSVAPPAPERISSLPDPFPSAASSAAGSSAASSSAAASSAASSSVAGPSAATTSSAGLSAVAPSAVAPSAAISISGPTATAQREKERRGLPIGAWIGIAGAMSFGVAMAVMIAPRLLGSADTSTAPAVATATVAAPTSEPVEAVVDTTVPTEAVAEAAPTEAAPTEPATPEAPATGAARTPRTPRTTTSTGSTAGTATTGGTTTPAAPSGRFAAFADDGAGAAPIDTRSTTRAAEGAERGGTSELTGDQVRSVVSRGQRQLQACWELEIRGMHDVQTTRMDVDVTIGASGTVMRATARGMGIGDLSSCIERNVRRWHFPPSSGETQTTFPIVFTGV